MLLPVPASVWEPLTSAVKVNPSGRPSAVTGTSTPSRVRGVPSYTFVSEAAVKVMVLSLLEAVLFAVQQDLEILQVTVLTA